MQQHTLIIPAISASSAPLVSILAAGEFPAEGSLSASILSASYVKSDRRLVCCDGAFDRLQKAGYGLPDAVVGDLDSISEKSLKALGDQVHRMNDQETNDLTKTVHYVQSRYAPSSLCILGLTGLREDHTLGNIALLPSYIRMGFELIVAPTPYGCLYAFEGKARIFGSPGRQVSLFDFCHSPLSTKGLKWELHRQVLSELWMGTLNEMQAESFEVNSSAPIVISLQDETKKRSR